LSHNQDRLKYLETKTCRLKVLKGLAIDLDETTALLGKSASSGGLFPITRVKRRRELANIMMEDVARGSSREIESGCITRS
jgi:hypothetical protein